MSVVSALITPKRCILILALVCGALYLSIVPPWQHYDEPTHFEYAWLIANRRSLPEPGDYDQAMRREVAASMVAHDFYRDPAHGPNLLLQDEPIPLGCSELSHPPGYYILVALPLTVLRHADVTLQLYAGRLVSLALYLGTILIAWGLVRELTPEGHVLRWMVPGMMALLPAYTDLMTAVNNDVGATVALSLFLWGGVRTIMRGVSALHLGWVLGSAALCVAAKNTASVAVLLAPLAIVLGLARERWSRWVWAAAGGAVLLLLMAVFSWGDGALWYRETGQEVPTRRSTAAAPLGDHALALEMTAEERGREVSQPLLREDVEALRGRTVTLGAWMWASRAVEVRSPMLRDGHGGTWERVQVGISPTFQAITATVATDAEWVEVSLRPLLDQEQEETVTVYYDGVVLVEGGRSLDSRPSFDGARAGMGTWGGETFVNRVRNASGEAVWPWVRPWVQRALRQYTRRSPMTFLSSVLDWRRTGWVYRKAGINLFQSFWARFGWNHVGLAEGWYWVLAVITGAGLMGALLALARRWSTRPLPWRRSVVWLVVAGLVVWGNAFLRSHPFVSDPFIPGARYTYPVVIPAVLALAEGWIAYPRPEARRKVALGILCGLALLDVLCLLRIWTFYGR